MRLWLDDDPNRKVPPGYDTVVRTAPEAIRLISSGKYTHVSLDHDLGDPTDPAIGTGYDVAVWIEEGAYKGTLPRLSWDVHSANKPGRDRMVAALTNANRYWTMHEQNISKASVPRIAVVAPSDKKVIDAFYRKQAAEGNRLTSDGSKLKGIGMGGGDIAEWRGPRVVITAIMDSKWQQSVVNYIQKTFPENLVSRVASTKFTLEEAKAIAADLGIDFEADGFDANQFMRGLNVELEHGSRSKKTDVSGDDPATTGKIAWAHLLEFPDYYDRLEKMESDAKEDAAKAKSASALPLRIKVHGHVYQRVAVSGRELDPRQLVDQIDMFTSDVLKRMNAELATSVSALKEYVKTLDEDDLGENGMKALRSLEDRCDSFYQDAWSVLDGIKSFAEKNPVKRGETEKKESEEED